MAKSIVVPAPSDQELELERLQGGALKRSNDNLTQLQPFMLENLGFTRDAQGNLVRMPTSTTEDPFLARGKSDQIKRLNNTYRSPQMEDSLLKMRGNVPRGTPVSEQAEGLYDRNEGILREGINRGGLLSGEKFNTDREGLISNIKARKSDQFSNMNAGDMKLISGIGEALQPYQQLREMAFNKNMQDASNDASEKAAQYQLGGAIVSAIIIAAFS